MQAEALKNLVFDIQKMKTEKQTVELKSAEKGCPTRLYDTLSSFSNQDEGGVIIFGVDENDKYKIKGVYDSQDLQKKVTEQCKQMEPMSEYEVYSYKAFRKRIRDDIRTVDEAKLQLLDEKRLNDYLTMVKQERRESFEKCIE